MAMISILYVLLVWPLLLLLALAPLSELLARFRRSGSSSSESELNDRAANLLFLIPAHDEERLIGDCVRSLQEMDYPPSRRTLIVIADNCGDATAQVAKAAGVRCLERDDPERPGKPPAIAWALETLEGEEWEACVIVDADTVVHRKLAAMLTAHAPLEDKCVQAYFDLSNEEESWLTRLAGVLAQIRYERQYPLKRASGLNCPLTGNGMCIGRRLLASGWPAFSLTENWELYALFTALGVPIEYESGARLFSEEVSRLSQADTQRKRWLAGRIWVLRRYLRAVLRSRKIDIHQKLDVIAELASPPPVLHGVAVLAIALSAPFTLPATAAATVVLVASATLVPLIVHAVAIIRAHPQRWRIAGSLVLLPGYALWRLVTAARTLTTLREGRWKKTERTP